MNEVEKICPICGNNFVTKKTAQMYCSADCKKIGAAEVRKKWVKTTGYNDKQRIARRKEREQKRLEKLSTDFKQEEAKRKSIEKAKQDHLKKLEADLMNKVKAGEPLANMRLCFRNKDMVSYWRWYKKYELEQEQLSKSNRVRIVNNISIHEDDFEHKVIDSIEKDGCIVETFIDK